MLFRSPAGIFLPESYKRNDYSPIGVRRAQSCLTLRPWQPVCPSPHHLLRLRHLWGRGVWGRGRLIMHSPISICGELRRCCRVMITTSRLGLRRDMNKVSITLSGQERSVRSRRRARAGAQTPSRTPKRMHYPISPLRKHHSSHHHHQYPQCFALLFSPCAT